MKTMQLEYVKQLTTGGDKVTVGKKSQVVFYHTHDY